MCQVTHNRYDEPVAPVAVEAKRCRRRDVVQFPLEQVFRAMSLVLTVRSLTRSC